MAAVTGSRYFDSAVQFTNATDVANISAGQSFVASSGATGTVVAVDNANFVVLLDVQSGLVAPGTTVVFTTLGGKGTINSINTDIIPATIVIDPITEGEFAEGEYLLLQTPKPILITPRTDEITGVNGDLLTLSGNKDLLNFAAGDQVTMVDANGDTAYSTVSSDSITDVEEFDIWAGVTQNIRSLMVRRSHRCNLRPNTGWRYLSS